MIITVTLNPCVHHILAYETPESEQLVIKPVRSFFQPGGKGLNAARVAASMGGQVLALTTWGDVEGRLLLREVEYSGVEVRTVEVSRPTRLSTCLYNLSTMDFMELLEPGAELDPVEVESLFNLVEESIEGGEYIALNGSSPCPGTDDFFKRAGEMARKKSCSVVVDTYGASLVQAVESVPFLVKMNREEIRISFGLEMGTEKDLALFARNLLQRGITHVLVTDGSQGAWLFSGDQAYRIDMPEIRTLHAIGSGDAMLGALLARLEKGDSLAEACRWGAAAGAVNAGRLEVCRFDRTLVEDLLPSVRMGAFNAPDL
ncbi:MAG: bifunctional hydroxymethylpyrimidine kinase/phosphomethylpyrimidine kinase [Planctomycetes bacterium]|nr:bifunctional hydroxymethylpyrimidine kinase/phosphomethylpyrimidine kinase [Planctomycetota bacterium]